MVVSKVDETVWNMNRGSWESYNFRWLYVIQHNKLWEFNISEPYNSFTAWNLTKTLRFLLSWELFSTKHSKLWIKSRIQHFRTLQFHFQLKSCSIETSLTLVPLNIIFTFNSHIFIVMQIQQSVTLFLNKWRSVNRMEFSFEIFFVFFLSTTEKLNSIWHEKLNFSFSNMIKSVNKNMTNYSSAMLLCSFFRGGEVRGRGGNFSAVIFIMSLESFVTWTQIIRFRNFFFPSTSDWLLFVFISKAKPSRGSRGDSCVYFVRCFQLFNILISPFHQKGSQHNNKN